MTSGIEKGLKKARQMADKEFSWELIWDLKCNILNKIIA